MVTEGLASFCDFLEKLGSRPALLAVPGNHDLVRTSPAAAADPAFWEADVETRNSFFSEATHPLRVAVATAFTPFSRWFDTFRQRCPGQANLTIYPGLLPGDFVATLKKKDRRFAFAGLNTAFLELAGHNAFGAVDIDPRQLVTAAGSLEDFVRGHRRRHAAHASPTRCAFARCTRTFVEAYRPSRPLRFAFGRSLRGSHPSLDAPHATLFVGHPFSGNVDADAKRGYAAGRF